MRSKGQEGRTLVDKEKEENVKYIPMMPSMEKPVQVKQTRIKKTAKRRGPKEDGLVQQKINFFLSLGKQNTVGNNSNVLGGASSEKQN